MKVTRGKNHTHLGMLFDFGRKGEVKIRMLDYVMDIIKYFPETIIKVKEIPAQDCLFKVREEEEKEKILPQEKAEQFHAFVVTLLLLCKRRRPDIQTAIAFLTTRVRKPDQDDWKKL